MIRKVGASIPRAVLGLARWHERPDGRGFDAMLGGVALGWLLVLILNPSVMTVSAYRVLSLLPDPAWRTVLTLMAVLHTVGAIRPDMRGLRMVNFLLAGWLWTSVGVGILAAEFTTGVPVYLVLGYRATLLGVSMADAEP